MNRQRIHTAAQALTVLGTGLRGVLLGVGSLTDVPVITPIENGSNAPVKSSSRLFIWNADKDVWTYAFISKGTPKQGTTIGLAQRGKIVFYNVTQVTTRVIKLKIDAKQVFARGSQQGDFAKDLTFDVSVFRDARKPTWFRSMPLDTEAKRSRILDNDTLRNLFKAAQDLALKAHKAYSNEYKDEAGTDAKVLEEYAKATELAGALKGRSESLAALDSWLDSYDGDPRTIASLRRHLGREKDALGVSMKDADKKVETLRKKLQDQHPGLRAAAIRLKVLARTLTWHS